MKNNIIFFLLFILIFSAFNYFKWQQNEREKLIESTAFIDDSIKNVSKIIVSESHFSEVFTFKNSKEWFGKYITSEKNALVVVNAEVSIIYDLSKISFELDSENKVLKILSVPKAELKINPDFEYYDIQNDFFNSFQASDYNEIKQDVIDKLKLKIEASSIKKNARDRLLSELTKFYILTNTLGWSLEYNQKEISNLDGFKILP